MKTGKPDGFFQLWLRDTGDDLERRGWWAAIVPWTFIVSAFLAILSVSMMPDYTFFSGQVGTLLGVLAGLLAFNALTMALSWNAFGKIYELLAKPGFSGFLQAANELSRYMFYISYFHYTQVFAAAATLLAIIWMFFDFPPIWLDRCVLGVALFGTFYALRWSVGSVKVAHDLVWNFSRYDNLAEDEKQGLRLAVNNDPA